MPQYKVIQLTALNRILELLSTWFLIANNQVNSLEVYIFMAIWLYLDYLVYQLTKDYNIISLLFLTASRWNF